MLLLTRFLIAMAVACVVGNHSVVVIAQDAAHKDSVERLVQRFSHAEDPLEKVKIAAVLVRENHDEAGKYLQFILEEARISAVHPIPDPMVWDDHGKPVKKALSKDFVAWCNQRGIDTKECVHTATFEVPSAMGWLSQLTNPRAFDVLVLGLKSRNPFVVVHAAIGLGKLRDERSLRALLDAAELANPVTGPAFASALTYFDDPIAREVGGRLYGNVEAFDALHEERRERHKDD